MSDINRRGVSHLVSELKVTRLGKSFGNYFQKGFKRKVCFEKHIPQSHRKYLLILRFIPFSFCLGKTILPKRCTHCGMVP